MRLVVTGAAGQVATALRQSAAPESDVEIICLARPEYDLAAPARLQEKIVELAPDIVVNAAAWTAVDAAESEADQAFAVNVLGAEAVALAAAKVGAPIVQISTDYVFSGEKADPYLETDDTAPQGVYGATKLEGERRVAAAHAEHVILRTSWVYSATGQNFLKTMLRLAHNRDALNIVSDQYGAPTHADEIARVLLGIARQLGAGPVRSELFGVFHMSCSGFTSWYGFAEEIFAASAAQNGPHAVISPIPTSEFPTPAKRPANSRLDCEKLAQIYGLRLADWRLLVAPTVEQVLSETTPA